jgi:tRNA G18 (ribose-2'-O)-methylase SpoU
MRRTAIRIEDPDDPRIAAYRDIRERDLVGRQGLFVAEGRVVLNVLARAPRFALQSVLVLENRLAGIADLLAEIPDNVPVHVCSASVLDAIAGFPIHRGILAIGRRPDTSVDAVLAGLEGVAVVPVLVGIANHDNVGAIFRNAAAFGAGAVLLDPTCCDPLYRKAIRVSVGGVFRVPFARLETIEHGIAALAESGFRIVALSPSGRVDVNALTPGGRTALLLGTEGLGLPSALLDRLETVRIPMAPGFDSLNVAATSAIALHRLWRPSG